MLAHPGVRPVLAWWPMQTAVLVAEAGMLQQQILLLLGVVVIQQDQAVTTHQAGARVGHMALET